MKLAAMLVCFGFLLGCTSARDPASSDDLRVPNPFYPDYEWAEHGAKWARVCGFHQPGDPVLTAEESQLISVAHDYLEKRAGKKIDAYYHPRKIEGGYYVDVNYITGYDARGNPKLTGPISSVKISEDWQTIDYIMW